MHLALVHALTLDQVIVAARSGAWALLLAVAFGPLLAMQPRHDLISVLKDQ